MAGFVNPWLHRADRSCTIRSIGGAAAREGGDIAPSRRTVRQALAELRDTYARQGGTRLAAAYRALRTDRWLVRWIRASIERIVPVERFLELAGRFDEAIRDRGYAAGCRAVLEDIALCFDRTISPEASARLGDSPVLLFGNHPSLLTPFLIGASLDRQDVRVLSTAYVRRLIPSLETASFPVEVPLTRFRSEWKKGGWRRAATSRLISCLGVGRSPEECKETNRRSLSDMVDHLVAGGCGVMFPDGGSRRSDTWFPGIGIVAQRVAAAMRDRMVYLVPIREEHSTNQRVYAQLRDGLWSRGKRAILYRRPIRLRVGAPIPLAEIVTPHATVEEIISRLRSHYAMAFTGASSLVR